MKEAGNTPRVMTWARDFALDLASTLYSSLGVVLLALPNLSSLTLCKAQVEKSPFLSNLLVRYPDRAPQARRTQRPTKTPKRTFATSGYTWSLYVVNIIGPRIRKLEIIERAQDSRAGHLLLGFEHFSDVRVLTTPSTRVLLGTELVFLGNDFQILPPSEVLPYQLHLLDLHMERRTKQPEAFLLWLRELVREKGSFPNIRQVRLFFSRTLHDYFHSHENGFEMAMRFTDDELGNAASQIDLMKQLQAAGVLVVAFFRGAPVNLTVNTTANTMEASSATTLHQFKAYSWTDVFSAK
ncbi:hypothetical protein EK21DRAFT_111553 [Setomelanomma holmii]|uniref:Uncharacterized protein n=1 Tax=Setomelanomma holmii TaxID=210430 RepID=A0A9P4LKY5_9PLEO|nr:hypothetical protein EK21DRAFT_111553 [Setomelanomma holmii]